MNFSLTPNLEQFVRDRARSGDYNNASEVVREALRLLKRSEEERVLKTARLRAAIAKGDEALASGAFTEVNSDEDLDAFFGGL
jgi:antitoxin ParD1/3/4